MSKRAQVLQRHRDRSPELGISYNKLGRPIRQSAGKKKIVSGYVDSAIIDVDDDSPIDMPSEDEDGVIIKRAKKRKRSPSPTPPPLEPIIHDEGPDEPSDDDEAGMFHRTSYDTPVTLQINIPLGYHGPLRVKLDRSILGSTEGAALDAHPAQAKGQPKTLVARPGRSAANADKQGFCRLPAELRNKIYEALFVADGDMKFHTPNNFCRSAQFLRTCRRVYSEGCSYLYGENRFVFDRNRYQRAPFWDPQPKEIGYKDVRQFLKMIGPENLSYLRDIKIIFEDASPAATPYLPSHESRRYINDEHLIDCLRILRETKLRKLTMHFNGRRMLFRTDVKFLGYLEQIKADEISAPETPRWYYPNKINEDLFKELKDAMTRKKRLYAEREKPKEKDE